MSYSKLQNSLIYLFSFSLVFESWGLVSLAGNSIPKLFAYLLIAVSLLKPGITLNIFLLRKYLTPLFLFLFLMIFSYILFADETYTGLQNLISILLNGFFFWFLANILTKKPTFAYKTFLATNIGIFLSTVLYMFGVGVEFSDGGRLTIFGENANRIGVFAVISTLFILSTIFENPGGLGKFRYLLILLLIPLLNITAQTGSRVSFLGLIISITLFFVFLKGQKKQTRILILIIGAVGVYLLYNYFMTFEVIQSRMTSFYEEGDLAGRDRIWEMIVPLIKQNPLFGIGISGYIEASLSLLGRRISPHNVYLEVLVYTGVLGFLAFMFFIFRVFLASYKTYRHRNYLLPFVLVLFILFVFFSGQGLNIKMYWMFYVFIVATWEGENINQFTK